MLQMSSMMGPGAGGGLGGGFPAPGFPSTASQTQGANPTTTPQTGAGATPTPPVNLFNPFGIPPPAAGGTGANPPGAGLFGDPAMMQQMLSALGGAPSPAAPADTRPPEERFQVQLQVSQSHTSTVRTVLTSCRIPATARHGIHKCITECSGIVGNRWQCPLRH